MADAGAVTLLLVLAGLGALLALLTLVAGWVRRRGRPGSVIAAAVAAYDEGFHGTVHDSFVEVRAAEERRSSAPSPGRRHPGQSTGG